MKGTGFSRPLVAGFAPLVLLLAAVELQAQQQAQDPLSDPFRGVTADGQVVQGLFPIRATGVSTDGVRLAADRFLGTLTPAQTALVRYPADTPEWRRWNNVSRADRNGVSFEEMSESQRDAAFAMLRAGLSARGMDKVRDIMRLNHHAAELVDNFDVYGEFLYWITVMGQPSASEPWGWQLEGHHLIVNYFVLGDQVVMTPTFMGSEPVVAHSGRYAGTIVLQEEQDLGLALMQSLRPDQRELATLATSKTGNNALAQAYRDNLVLDYQGIRGGDLSPVQREHLVALIGEYAGNLSDGHARVRMEEVRRYLDETYFAWIGEVGPETTFYYRVHSPVILIEFDHQVPVALPGPRVPNRAHIHTVVRTPNGNDYGTDLLRQHYEDHRHDVVHGHQH